MGGGPRRTFFDQLSIKIIEETQRGTLGAPHGSVGIPMRIPSERMGGLRTLSKLQCFASWGLQTFNSAYVH